MKFKRLAAKWHLRWMRAKRQANPILLPDDTNVYKKVVGAKSLIALSRQQKNN